ncbi:MAG: helix-turn-helix transcriptional regulator [Candidatus Omnitrophica bacterium]|nr:helix-turn-helix transcriptional regulator [Candidatus Omnitrophota bacterium]
MTKVGNKIRELRKQKNITLIEFSNLTGVAQATLSRVETGDMPGTIECHHRIANALGISLSELYEGIDHRNSVTHVKKVEPSPPSAFQADKVRMELRTSKALKKKLLPVVISIKGHSEMEEERADRSVEKFLYVLEGEVIVNLNKQEIPLKQDESVYFDGSFSHRIENKLSKVARVLSITSPPA